MKYIRPPSTDIYRYSVAAVNSIKIIIRSLFILGVQPWIGFWITRSPEKIISLASIRHFGIRGTSLHQKIVDLYMAVSCIVDEQYTPPPTFTIHPKDTVIDIGGHIGSFSALASSRADEGKVLTFEPDPENFSQLTKNLYSYQNARAFQKAVAGDRGSLTLYKDSLNSAENSLFKKGGRAITVPTLTLRDIFEEHDILKCNFLKIDCEGAEYDILYATPSAFLERIERIVLEAHCGKYFDFKKEGYSPEELASFLRKNGFSVKIKKENAMHSLIWAHRPH